MLRDLWDDLRYAFRAFGRSPGFAAAAVATIALGVGINTGIFSVLNGVLFRDLPAPEAHELVSVFHRVESVGNREGARETSLVSTAQYRAYRDRTQTLSGILGHSDPTRTTLGGDSPREIVGTIVTCDYLDVLRQPPALGRGLRAQDCEAGADPVIVLSHDLWTASFDTDPRVIGRTIELNRQLFTVVGVAAEGTYSGFPYRTGYFAPISAEPLLLPAEKSFADDKKTWLVLVGRRKSDASIEQVRSELGVIAAQFDAPDPSRASTVRVGVERSTTLPLLEFRSVALAIGGVIMAPFAFVLLIACANVANLLLARGEARSREIALRISLGASRARVLRQLLTESALISLAGGVLGSVLSLWSFQLLLAFALPSFSPVGIPPIVVDASPDLRVLSFALILTFVTGIVFGVAPALRASAPDLHAVMKQDSPGGGQRGGRLQGTLVGAQVTVCIVLMIGAGLLLRGLYATQTVDPGFVYRDVVVAAYDLEGGGYDPEKAAVFQRQLLERVSALPGVESAAYALQEPLSSDTSSAPVRLPTSGQDDAPQAVLNTVTPGYFSLVGTPIVSGRNFTDADLANAADVAIVSEETARRYWPGQDAIGQTLVMRRFSGDEVALQVIGVARDAQLTWLGQVDPYYLYLPATTRMQTLLELLVKSRADYRTTAAGIEASVRTLDPGLWVRVNPLEANIEWSRNLSRIVTALAASLGALALVLAAVGIYGVVAYFVTRRFREIGIRMALGAKSRNVLGLILRRTMRPVLIGAAVGVGAGAGLSSVLSSVLFGVSPVDPAGLIGAASFVLFVALMAGALASRPATRVDPMVTLRHD
jgi:predicted permease